MIIVDSDVLIDALRGRKPAIDRVALELKSGALATTAITAFELLSGARSGLEQRKVEDLIGGLVVLSVDADAATIAARVRRELEKAGQKIGLADYLIAGLCLSRGAVLLTNNRKHFERVEGLKVSGSTA